MSREEIIRANLEKVIKLFERGELAEALAIAVIPIPNIPLSKWSLGNRLIALANRTNDARGFRQWQEIGRFVKRGAKAFYIFGPIYTKKLSEEENRDTGELQQVERRILTGFRLIPVFRQEDTEGEPLDYSLEPPELPSLIIVAEAWGIPVTYAPFQGIYYGKYGFDRRDIEVATHEERVFLHELAHASHARVRELSPGQDPHQEIIAELSAQVLARMYGKEDPNEGASYVYINRYAERLGKPLTNYLWQIIGEIELVIGNIVRTYEELKGEESTPLLSSAKVEWEEESEGYWPPWASL